MSDAPTHLKRKSLPRRLEKALKRALVGLAVAVIPQIYVAYMWLVWRTSRVEIRGVSPHDVRRHYGKQVIALWHEEVFFVAWAFREFRPSTLASRGDFGALVTRMLELCDFEVFRGGSSSGRSRRSPEIVKELVDHMNENAGVLYGLTVDGSAGPRYHMKPGAPKIAAVCRAPFLVEKTWCKRYLRLPTWDRTIVPLPFNHIVHVFAGPYLPPADSDRPRPFKAFARGMEEELRRVTWQTRTIFEDPSDPDLLRDYPPGWTPPAEPMTLVRPFDPVPPLQAGATTGAAAGATSSGRGSSAS